MNPPSHDPVAQDPVTVFRNRPRVLLFLFVLGLILTVQGGATAGYFVLFDDGAGFQLAGIGLSVFVILMGIGFAGYSLFRIRDRHAPITISAEGLHDRILSRQPIAWSDLRNIHVWPLPRGGPVVGFQLAEGAESRAGVFKRARLAAAANRPFGYDYQIHAMGTDADVDHLVAAIRTHADVRTSDTDG